MVKIWKNCQDNQCPECGNDLEIFTISKIDAYFVGDEVRCVECNYTSEWDVDEDGNGDYFGYVQ